MRSHIAVWVTVGLVLMLASTVQADTIYCTGQSGRGLATIDTTSGVGANVGLTGFTGVWAAAFDNNDGTLYTTVNWGQRLGKFNQATGAVTTIGPAFPNFGSNTLIALEVANDGTLYGADWGGRLWTINKTTGARTLVGGGGVFNVMDLAFDSNGTLWATSGNRLYTVNTSTGAAMFKAFISGVSGSVMGIMFDANDVLYATPWIFNAGLYTVDTSTGAATFIGSTGLSLPHGGDILLDSDGDGIPDYQDACVNSDLRPTVIIDGCDSGVGNVLFQDGCTITDLILACADGAKNHGDFVSCVAKLTNQLKSDGVITGKEKGAIQSCAAKADLP